MHTFETMHPPVHILSSHRSERVGDRVLLAAIAVSACAAVAIGFAYEGVRLAVIWTSALLLVGALGFHVLPGLWARAAMTTSLTGFVMLHIQLSQGMLEFHFGVFVTLALLMVYRDWRLIVFGAALFAVHHFLFDRLQAAGFGVFCTTKPDFWRIVLHAAYVVLQTGLEVILAVWMARVRREGDELSSLVRSIDDRGQIVLDDVGSLAASSPTGRALKEALVRMRFAVHAVRQSAEHVEHASAEIASGNLDLSQRTEETAQQLQTASSQIETMAQAVHQAAASSKQASSLALDASGTARRGSDIIGSANATMLEIQKDSRRIAEITSVIDGIAFQTNILALNAAVEAARAGEEGRGFAVVASEVRTLSKRSADAAREIRDLINSATQQVDSGAHLMQDARMAMDAVVEATRQVSGTVDQIADFSHAQSTTIGQVNEAVRSVDEMTQRNAALVEESAASSSGLHAQALHLTKAVEVFRQGIQPALAIRSAGSSASAPVELIG